MAVAPAPVFLLCKKNRGWLVEPSGCSLFPTPRGRRAPLSAVGGQGELTPGGRAGKKGTGQIRLRRTRLASYNDAHLRGRPP